MMNQEQRIRKNKEMKEKMNFNSMTVITIAVSVL